MTITDLRTAILEHGHKNQYLPKAIILSLGQLHDLLKSGEALNTYVDRENMNTFMGIPFAVEGSSTTLDMRGKDSQ